MNTALMFPGQGSQRPGMGSELYHSSQIYRDLLDEADRATGIPIVRTMHQGSDEDLRDTRMAQLAVFCMSCGLHSVAKSELPTVQAVAGHSLGEFTALVASGAMSFADAVVLVATRAKLMEQATTGQHGCMSAILGMDKGQIEPLLADIDGVWIANHNSLGQVVISGGSEAIASATQALDGSAKRILPLAVSGAFHTPLLQVAADQFIPFIDSASIEDPHCPVYGNSNGLRNDTADSLKSELYAQMTSSVEWVKTLTQMWASGIDTFIEIGPGRVLSGLARKTLPDAKIFSIGSLADIENLNTITASTEGN